MRRDGRGWIAVSALALMAATACERAEVRSYRVARTGPTATTPTQRQAGMGEVGKVRWEAPAGWRVVESSQSMRVATFDAGGVEVSVTAFAGSAGGALANINRWRGQIGLVSIAESELGSLLKTSRSGSTEVSLATMEGSKGEVMLGAIIVPGDGQTWFVKATTDKQRADALHEDFVRFAASFRFDAVGVGAAASTERAGAGDPQDSPRGGIEQRLAAWTPPSNWKVETTGNGILAASFHAENAAGGARATAASLLNDGGGLLANVNRWRAQVGLPSVQSMDGQPTGTLGGGAVLVDIGAPDGKDRMIAVIVPSGTATWFFKLRGTRDGLEKERAAFESFVRTVGLGS